MPNNNPAGHNQYTRRKEDFAQSSAPQPGDSRHEDSRHEAAMTEPGSATTSTSSTSTPAKRGFAAMDEAMQRGIASKGGQSQGKENNPGNFANDRDRAREAGRKGGEAHGMHREGHSSTNH
jgi:general stress protein YciG